MEFLARCGDHFLRCYHRAWIGSDDGIALACEDEKGEIVGVLLGALRPSTHFRKMVRTHGVELAFWLFVRAATRPRFARELFATRLLRYVRGITRMVLHGLGRFARGAHRRRSSSVASGSSSPEPTATEPAPPLRLGEVTHIMVRHDAQGKGVGRALVETAERAAQQSGLDELVLVTPPDLAAVRFYEHLGWQCTGELKSRSGEDFIGYRLQLRQEDPSVRNVDVRLRGQNHEGGHSSSDRRDL
jgi:ribosomal protein S18 acetylase RimI-like enzyme